MSRFSKQLKIILNKKKRAAFAGGVLVFVLASIILFNSAFGGINYLPDKILKKSGLQNITKFAAEKFSALGQEMPTFFFPHFPQRLMYVTAEIAWVSEELVSRNEKLLEFTNGCGCQFAESNCKQVIEKGKQTDCIPNPVIKVFGEPCPTKGEIEEKQGEIHDLTLHLTFLQDLLKEEVGDLRKGEMDVGLRKQLDTLRPEDAKILEDNLMALQDLSPQLADAAQKNLDLPNQCSVVNKCSPDCQQGTSFSLEGCVTIGQQKPIELKISAGIGLDDLDLGTVEIKDINLNLPEEIQMPLILPTIPGLTISIPDITLTCPIETRSITFHAPTPTLPEPPTLTLSCPDFSGLNYQSYQCSTPSGGTGQNSKDFEWYFQTFSYLSGECLKVAQKDFTKLDTDAEREEYQLLMKGCMAPGTVAQTIVDECEKKWRHGLLGGWYLPGGKPEICGQIGRSPNRTSKAIEWCQKLFQQEGAIPPATCSTKELKEKCDQLRNAGKEEPPLSCKLLPLFTGSLENPTPGTIWGQGGNCPATTMGDYPNPVPGCAFAFPSAPKISFPQIIIPDIHLPSFNFPPFFNVKLPNFIFEDLILPDLDLCNLDDCQSQFPYLSFEIPSLKIPEIEVPAVPLNIPGAPQIEVKVAPIQFPPLAFNFPQLFNLSSLATPELEMPSFDLPQPELKMSFTGLDIGFDLIDLLLGLLKTPGTYCGSIDTKLAPIRRSYPDYYFGWPAFPRIEEIKACKDIREWCTDKAKPAIQKITDKTAKIQNKVNDKFASEIQDKLDKLGQSINKEIRTSIESELNKISQKIKTKMDAHIAKYVGQEYVLPPEAIIPGVWPVKKELPCDKIPPLTIRGEEIVPGKNIVIAPKSLSDIWEKETGKPYPNTIPIDWPDELKKIQIRHPDSSKNIPCQINDTCPIYEECAVYDIKGICQKKQIKREECYEDKKCGRPFGYDLPTISLEKLRYSKEKNIRLPGFQRTTPTISFNLLENATACASQPPKGGNPCQDQVNQIETNLGTIKGISGEIKQASQKIKDVLY